MARSKETKIELTAYDDLFETDQSREEAKLSKIRDIPISEIDEFPDHPFKVFIDEDMEQLVDSIKRNGVMTPATVRLKEDGRYELISGHRRKETIDTNTYGKSTGRSGNYSTNYQISGRELMTPDEVRMLDNRYALLFIRGERPVMDFKYDILKHPNVKLTTDGGQPPYIHGEPTQAVATLVFDNALMKNAVSVKPVKTSYELLSEEDLEEQLKI